MIGEILAAKFPDRLHSLTICSSPTSLPAPALTLFAFGYRDWPTACRTLGSRGWAECLSKVPGTLEAPSEDYRQWWIGQIAVSSAEGLAEYATFLSTLDSRDYLTHIKVPILILAPANSAATPLEEQRCIKDAVRQARLEVINGRGHEIYVEMPEQCLLILRDFLKSIRG